jgi:hypothetical protein
MRILVCGSREYDDWGKVLWALEPFDAPGHTTIIQGGAKGADFLARVWAKWKGVDWVEFPADWKKHGKAAGGIRNQQMLDEGKPDLVVAFPGGVGTADMVRRAKQAGVEVVQID